MIKRPLCFLVPFFCAWMYSFGGWGQIIKKPIPDKTVVFTFDDATASQYATVAPLLVEYGFEATFFICEFPPNFADSSLYMNWRQIAQMDRMGFDIGNHTKTHRGISKLTKEELIWQLEYIESKCDSMGIKLPLSFAYPGYDLNLSSMATLQEKGYLMARAGGSRPYDPEVDHPLLLPSWALEPDNQDTIYKALEMAEEGKVVILTIHGVPDLEHPWVTTSPEQFIEYLGYLRDKGFNVISLRTLGTYLDLEKAAAKLTPDLAKPLRN